MSLTTTDKQDIRQMIKDGIETSPIILCMESAIKRLEVLNEDMSHRINAVIEFMSLVPEISEKVKKS